MTDLLAYTVVGLVVGSIYAVAASGLVVTYTTSGIFNFAHGAIGMVIAFSYWQLRVGWHWPAPLALVVALGVLAPATGALIERVVVRPLRGASVGVTLVVTLGIMLALLFGSFQIWSPSEPRVDPKFFGNGGLRIFGVQVTWHQMIVVATAGVVALLLRLLFRRTRIGVAMRAVVDDADLTALNAVEPDRVSMLSWALGAVLAGAAGILIAPLVTLDALTLTLLVINAYAAAVVGRLKSLPLTFAGAIALGLLVSYGTGYFPQSDVLNRVQQGLPTIFLLLALLVLPSTRLRTPRLIGTGGGDVPGLRTSVAAGVALIAVAAVAAVSLSISNLITAGDVLAFGVILLSLVLLTGYGGQVSICQLTFAGIGAFVVGNLGATPFGFAAAIGCAALLGALVALPAIRLQGLYLALATLAVARFVDLIFFNDPKVFGAGGSLEVERFHLGPLAVHGERAEFVFLAVAFAVVAVGVLSVRRGFFGRQLAAMGDSPAACSTLGMDLARTKLIVFTVSAGIAGFGGGLLGGLHTAVSANDFVMLQSLSMLLIVTLAGVGSVAGALLGGLFFAGSHLLLQHHGNLANLVYAAPGIGVVVLARHPGGVVSQIRDGVSRLRARREGLPAAARPGDVAEVAEVAA
ncbi:MAG: amino acid/amide transporter rane protein 2, family / amino acid/amide transporter [Acidimicrobiales bacterium]|nr:amino acid/amide transporter rane protein 2, family / amino acid/amide transporter [Acidimicrobiales bacterium]